MIAATLAGIAIIAIGLVLPRTSARLPGQAGRSAPRPKASCRGTSRQIEVDYPHAVELLILAVRAGYLPVAAVDLVGRRIEGPVGAAFIRVTVAVDSGQRFADALPTLADDLGPIALVLVDTLSAADRYGLPLGPTLDRLAAEAGSHRRRSAEARLRQLPVRLAAPLVLCTLPSFVFLAIAPLLIGAISSLRR